MIRMLVIAALITLSSLVRPAAAADPGWPRTYAIAAGGRLQIYQPQIASWDGQAHLVAWVAVAYYASDAQGPAVGTIKVEADTKVSLEQRLVSFATFTITETNFPAIGRAQTRAIVAEVERAMPSVERVIALDRVLAGLDRSQIRPKNVEGVKADPPAIFFSTTPAVLVAFDGDPIWSPIAGNDLRYAVNTDRDAFEHVPTKMFYLRHDEVWLKASAIAGPWMPASTLPASFTKLPWDENWTRVKASLPGRRILPSEMPAVFVSTGPAASIVLRGAPRYVPVSIAPAAAAEGEPLLWIENTDSDLFRLGASGPVYYLYAGRWFSAPDFNGPWTFATPSLPAAFRTIPREHPRARVLASVPGTSAAAEAVLLAQMPQTARVDKQRLQAPEVRYQGEPQYVRIESTTLERAVNTNLDIVKAEDRYYLCYQGVWFVSATPRGPWIVTGRVPAIVYTIPASSPIHHVTYVTIVEDNPDWVVVAARAGYTGTVVAWGCAVWGTGWYYPSYYPAYGAAYGAAYGVARGAYGTYARGAVAAGPYGARGVGQAYNPYTGTYAQTRQGADVYGSWGSTYVQRGDDWARTSRASNYATGTTGRVTRTDDGAMVSGRGPNGRGFVAAGEEGIYAGRDGSVYRRADGGWQKYENGGWGATTTPVRTDAAAAREGAAGQVDRSTIGQLDADRSARLEGSQRVRDRAAASASPPATGAPNLANPPERPAGGARRAGGGPRGGRRR